MKIKPKSNRINGIFNGRLRIVLQDLGYRYDTINAVLATSITSLPTLKNKISSLEGFRQAKEFDDLYTAFDRCSRLAIVKNLWNKLVG